MVGKMNLTDIRDLYREKEKYIGKEITVGGWVRSNRDSKNFGFLVINDGTFFEPLQVVYGDKLANFDELCKMNGCHSVSNIKYKDNIKLGFWAYDVASGFTWSQWRPLDDIQFLKVAYAFYSNEKENVSLIVPNFFDNELIEKYKKFNFISKDDNSDFELNIPVLNKNEFEIYIEEIINKSIDDFSNKFKSELEELYINPIKPPKHLTKKTHLHSHLR